MTKLARLLNPRSIAVIGGGTWAGNAIRAARKFGFAGPIWPVHPFRKEICGEAAVASIADLPGAPDAAFVAVNRHATIEAVAALSQIRAGGATCFASGFSEARAENPDGPELQAELLRAAGDMPILGPNCYGFINALDGVLLWPDQHGLVRSERGVGIITQSSNIALSITMQKRALPIGAIITAGNQAQTGIAEIGTALLADPRISTLGLHIEGIGDIGGFEALAADAHARGKPIVALKLGRSSQACSVAVSHTASLAGTNAGADAFLHRLGIGRADTLPGFLEALKLLHLVGPLASRRLASLSCSGGEASLIADLALSQNIAFPPMDALQKRALRRTLGPHVALANPLDYHTYIWGDAAAMHDTYATAAHGVALAVVIADFPRSDRCEQNAWRPVIDAVRSARKATDTPFAIAATLPENMPEDIARALIDDGIVPFAGLAETLEAVRVAADCARSPQVSPVLSPRPPVRAALLDEVDAKAALAAHGLRIPRGRRVFDPADLPAAAKELTYPLVLKGLGHAHKSEAGAIALDLHDEAAVMRAADNMHADTYLLEEMITDVVAELLLGVTLDVAHGYVLTLAAGGTLAELVDDSVSLILPTDGVTIETALRSLNIAGLLTGWRGGPGADMDAVIESALALQAWVLANHGRVEEVEINPLLALTKGAIAADALIRTGETN